MQVYSSEAPFGRGDATHEFRLINYASHTLTMLLTSANPIAADLIEPSSVTSICPKECYVNGVSFTTFQTHGYSRAFNSATLGLGLDTSDTID